MDWAKAKTILIIALLATNLFLLYNIAMDDGLEMQGAPQREQLIEYMAERNVILDMDMPDVINEMPMLSVEFFPDTKEILLEDFDASEYVLDADATGSEYIQVAEIFIQHESLASLNLAFEKAAANEEQIAVTFQSYYNDIPIGENHIEVIFEEGELTDVKGIWMFPTEVTEREIAVISPEEALLEFMSKLADKEEYYVVEDMQLVFWVNSDSFGGETAILDTAFPAWVITYNGDEEKYIEASRT